MSGFPDYLRGLLGWWSRSTVIPASKPAGFWVCLDSGRNWTCWDSGTTWRLTMSTQPTKLAKKFTASRSYFADFSQYAELREGDALTGAPTVTTSPTGLTLSGAVVAGGGVMFRAQGGTAGVEYTISISCATTSGNTLAEDVVLSVY